MSVEDLRFINLMEECVHNNSTGHLEFPLPFRRKDTRLPNNRVQAKRRLKSLLHSLSSKPDTMKEYQAFMEKIISKGHASPVQEDYGTQGQGKIWYLPHFAVHHPRKARIRVVFDASAEFDGISLNKALLQGPDQMNSLLGILLRFRTGYHAVMGDVEQMFHNFYVEPKDRSYLRFLWFEDNDPTKRITAYQMNVHLFGNVSSPAVATFGLRTVADRSKLTHGPDVTKFICQNFYVDDGLTSLPDAPSAVDLVQRSCDALSKYNLRFHKIVSNSREVMEAIPEGDRAADLTSVDLQRDDPPTQRTLGVYWDLASDTFTFKVDLPKKPFSRRGVLSIASSVFDPIGLVTPVSIQGKLLLRELMRETNDSHDVASYTWDEILPEPLRPKWERWRDSLGHLEGVRVPRCYIRHDFGQVLQRELHVFSDASELAIGAVVYLRQVNSDGSPHVSLVMSKGKLTPKHAVSIPRLELCAAVLATSLVLTVGKELNELGINSVTYYTDSKVVLGYISNESKRFHVYVANRVHKIHTASDLSQWRHVPTDQNPADLITRTVPADRLMASTWFTGPDFLWLPNTPVLEGCELVPRVQRPLDPNDPDVRQRVHACATDVKDDAKTTRGLESHRFQRFSSWQSLRRAVANLKMRAKSMRPYIHVSEDGTKTKAQTVHSPPSAKDLHGADLIILKAVQREHFTEELNYLQSTEGDEQRHSVYRRANPLRKLNPFLDEDGLIRVGGRLRQADIDLGGRHPVLLPKENHVSKLIAENFHRDVQHQGRHSTMGAVRAGGFWILGIHGIVRSLINECTTCKRLRATPLTQQMADLPKDRTDTSPAFTNVGMDVFGPWTVVTRRTRGGSADSKRWAVLFTCLSSRAVHVEVIESMDTSSLIMALRRFTATRGPISRLRWDQGTNFVGACNELNAAAKNMSQGGLRQFLSLKGIEWVFNPPHASHFGGVWERQIRTLRGVLDSMFPQLGKHQLTHEILVTFMAEAAAIVNSRPICGVSSDANDPAPLTPNMLLTQKTTPLQSIRGEFTCKDLYSRKRWRRTQYLADQFWVRWRKEYLQSLQPRQKWLRPQPNVTTGDVVLLREKEVPRGSWPLARIVKTFESEDGQIRKADVLVCTNGTRRTFSRPISELILIEKSSPAES